MECYANLSACHSRAGVLAREAKPNPALRNKLFPAQTRLLLDSRLRGNDGLALGVL